MKKILFIIIAVAALSFTFHAALASEVTGTIDTSLTGTVVPPPPVSVGGGTAAPSPAPAPAPSPAPATTASTSTASTTVPTLPTNIDGFNILMANWGSTTTPNTADANGDGKVDILDFNWLMIHWAN